MKALFITGIGTGVGKTVWSAVLAEALHADYWKPVQAGFVGGTDALTVGSLVTNSVTRIHPEVYKLALPASPHIAARQEGVRIDLQEIMNAYRGFSTGNEYMVIEGAGGIMVPLNEQDFMADLVKEMNARVLIVSRNYLGSINHSLLTFSLLREREIPVAGWLFNDRFMDYEQDLVEWSGIPCIGKLPFAGNPDKVFVKAQAERMAGEIRRYL